MPSLKQGVMPPCLRHILPDGRNYLDLIRIDHDSSTNVGGKGDRKTRLQIHDGRTTKGVRFLFPRPAVLFVAIDGGSVTPMSSPSIGHFVGDRGTEGEGLGIGGKANNVTSGPAASDLLYMNWKDRRGD